MLSQFRPEPARGGDHRFSLPDCWFIRFRDAHGIERNLTIYVGRLHWPSRSPLDPLYMTLIILASVVLSIMVARVTSLPLRRLTRAARAFSVTADPEPIQVGGPREVRVALETFNLMQQRVREGFRQRTQILAAVTHDLPR
jgi:signal transduction histidine kinase